MARLTTIVEGFAAALKAIDARRPVAINSRSGAPYQPGIGPHGEVATVGLVTTEWRSQGHKELAACTAPVAYVLTPRRFCDLCIGSPPRWDWAIEVKLLRMLGDNAKPNDNMLMHLLSPYAEHRSALTDCEKLVGDRLGRRVAAAFDGLVHPVHTRGHVFGWETPRSFVSQ